MSKPEGEIPDFEQLEQFGDDLFETEPAQTDPADAAPEINREQTEGKSKKKRKKKEKRSRKKKEEAAAPEDGEKKDGGVLAAIAKLDLFTIMLGLSVLAVFLAVIMLIIEWSAYDFDTKAKGGKRFLSMAPIAQSGPPSTTAAA